MLLNLFSEPKPSSVDRANWERDGFLILKGLISPEKVRRANAEVERLTHGEHENFHNVTVDVLHGDLIGKRLRLEEAPASAFSGPIKINDLYLESEDVRACNLDAELVAILKDILKGDPIVINSLNFIYGSQQPPHFDTWYMPPPVEGAMAVASICLDEMTDSNGPLIYYPGSHKLPPYRFSHGRLHATPEEMPACEAYVSAQIANAKISPQRFYGQPGDVFIWHAQLLHGGAPITEPTQTRRSLVTHFWRRADVDRARVRSLGAGRYYLDRPHQSV